MMQTFDKSAWYTIAAKVSGKVIEAENASTENGAAVCLAEATGADQQLWSITHIDGKYYKIANKKSGKVLDIISLGVVNGANLHQWEYVNGDSQLWFFEEKDDGAVAIKSAMSAKCIDVVGMNADADGAVPRNDAGAGQPHRKESPRTASNIFLISTNPVRCGRISIVYLKVKLWNRHLNPDFWPPAARSSPRAFRISTPCSSRAS